MIPTLLVIGMVVGILSQRRLPLRTAVVALVVAALLWGLAVGIASGAVVIFFLGSGLALVNLIVGAIAGASLVRATRRLVA